MSSCISTVVDRIGRYEINLNYYHYPGRASTPFDTTLSPNPMCGLPEVSLEGLVRFPEHTGFGSLEYDLGGTAFLDRYTLRFTGELTGHPFGVGDPERFLFEFMPAVPLPAASLFPLGFTLSFVDDRNDLTGESGGPDGLLLDADGGEGLPYTHYGFFSSVNFEPVVAIVPLPATGWFALASLAGLTIFGRLRCRKDPVPHPLCRGQGATRSR